MEFEGRKGRSEVTAEPETAFGLNCGEEVGCNWQSRSCVIGRETGLPNNDP
jgi:hypothetical protein